MAVTPPAAVVMLVASAGGLDHGDGIRPSLGVDIDSARNRSGARKHRCPAPVVILLVVAEAVLAMVTELLPLPAFTFNVATIE